VEWRICIGFDWLSLPF